MRGTAKRLSDMVNFDVADHRGTRLHRFFQTRLQHVVDLAVLVTALMAAYMLRFDFAPSPEIVRQALTQAPYVILIQFLSLILWGIYTFEWQYVGRAELRPFVLAATSSALPIVALRMTLPDTFETWRVPLSVIVSDTVLTLGGLLGIRIVQKEAYEWFKRRDEGRKVRRVLVIGGAGYIGSALLPRLLKKGYQVRVLDLLVYGTEAIGHLMDHPRLEVVRADFRQVDKVVDAMNDVDAVIHLGAIVGDPACALDENLTIEVNLMATRMIAEVAKGTGISRFIFASTCSVYGASEQILSESSGLNPISMYARSKIASERVLLKMADAVFAPTVLRFGTIYGLSGRTRFDLVVNLLTAKAVVDGQITVKGGDQWRPFVHVQDAASAVVHALEAPLSVVRCQIFNVGSDEQNHTIQEIGEIIARQVPSAHIINSGPDTDRRNYRVAFAKIRTMLNFVPEWTVATGVGQVIDAIRRGDVKDYRDAKHSNVKFLTEEVTPRLIPQEGWAYALINESIGPALVPERELSGPRPLVHLVTTGAPQV
jgi:nucleoside-diphosphate-sugar epimerase